MTPPKFSVLLLAWDDADPSVAVLGGPALPPTQKMVYQLAAQQPVLAVYPHLPTEPAPAAGRKLKKTTSPAQASEAPEPGIRPLPLPLVSNGPAGPGPQSRIIGLNDLTAARSAQPQAIPEPPTAGPAPRPVAPARSQWPPAPAPGPPRHWQAPTAPYAGASPNMTGPPPAPPQPPPAPRPTSATLPPGANRPATLRPSLHPLAGDLSFDPDPELPAVPRSPEFDEPTEEIGVAEAHALSAPEDDLVTEAPESPVSGPLSLAPAAPSAPAVLFPVLDGLNFRMIQYARQAAQLVRDRRDFGVIYAPNWPAWLAALEIRNSSGQPLVLYLAELAADGASPAERGWLLEVERMALRRAALILVPSEQLCRRLRAQYKGTIGEVRVVAAADEQMVQQVLSEVAAG